MDTAKTFSEWWRSMGPIDYKMDRRSAIIAWNAAQKAMKIAPSASTNSAMDAIAALVEQWKATIPKVQHVWGVDTFMEWARQRHQ